MCYVPVIVVLKSVIAILIFTIISSAKKFAEVQRQGPETKVRVYGRSYWLYALHHTRLAMLAGGGGILSRTPNADPRMGLYRASSD